MICTTASEPFTATSNCADGERVETVNASPGVLRRGCGESVGWKNARQLDSQAERGPELAVATIALNGSLRWIARACRDQPASHDLLADRGEVLGLALHSRSCQMLDGMTERSRHQ